jgi:hypothetical protein
VRRTRACDELGNRAYTAVSRGSRAIGLCNAPASASPTTPSSAASSNRATPSELLDDWLNHRPSLTPEDFVRSMHVEHEYFFLAHPAS